jgi:hypothetical protein
VIQKLFRCGHRNGTETKPQNFKKENKSEISLDSALQSRHETPKTGSQSWIKESLFEIIHFSSNDVPELNCLQPNETISFVGVTGQELRSKKSQCSAEVLEVEIQKFRIFERKNCQKTPLKVLKS